MYIVRITMSQIENQYSNTFKSTSLSQTGKNQSSEMENSQITSKTNTTEFKFSYANVTKQEYAPTQDHFVAN